MKKRLITAALPYVNNVPHLGNLIQVLSADCFYRFSKIKNYDAIYICGTDEYGTATETTAYKLGIPPKQLCDKYHEIHKNIYEWFDIDFSYFGRTSSQKHIGITQDIFKDIYNNGYIVEKETQQYYSENADMFLADRYLIGTCPHCGYEKARGDQCDVCSKLLKAEELINPVSALDGSSLTLRDTNHLYLDLPKLSDDLKKFVDEKSTKNKWSNNAVSTTYGWLKEGLDLRPITRDLKWGTPVPLPGWEKKVFYVWFDAPIGYISITANLTDNWKDWWNNPDNVNLYNFIGKDNITFHTVIFPSSLIATKKNWTLLNKISSTEYLNYNGGKFSKSENRGIFGDDAQNSGIHQDMWRFYLYLNRPESSDYNFTLKDFFEKVSAHLIGNYSNLVNRTLSFYNNNLKDLDIVADLNLDLFKQIKEKINNIELLLEDIQLKEALKEILLISDMANKYFQDNKPWELIKSDKQKTLEIISNIIYMIKDITILIYPYIPSTSKKIFGMLSLKESDINFNNLLNFSMDMKVINVEKLFNKLELADIENLEIKFKGEPVGFFKKVDLVCAQIKEVQNHPDAENLYILKLDDGTEQVRTIVSGLVKYYKPEDLLEKKIALVRNLKPAKLRGIQSNGMLLATDSQNCEVVFVDGNPGDRFSDDKDAQINKPIATKQITIDEFKSLDIEVINHKVTVEKDKKVYLNKKEIELKTSDAKLK